jgi:hypothetical protein
VRVTVDGGGNAGTHSRGGALHSRRCGDWDGRDEWSVTELHVSESAALSLGRLTLQALEPEALICRSPDIMLIR